MAWGACRSLALLCYPPRGRAGLRRRRRLLHRAPSSRAEVKECYSTPRHFVSGTAHVEGAVFPFESAALRAELAERRLRHVADRLLSADVREGRPHPRDLGALSGPPARIYFRSRRRRARRRARRRRLRHVADRLLSADVREGSPAPPGLDASTSARGHFCFRSGRRRSRRPPRGVENSYFS